MINYKATTPMNVKKKLKLKVGTCLANIRYYRSLVGSLIYLTHTQPDITLFVVVVSRLCIKQAKHHLKAVKRILCYIIRTTNYNI